MQDHSPDKTSRVWAVILHSSSFIGPHFFLTEGMYG